MSYQISISDGLSISWSDDKGYFGQLDIVSGCDEYGEPEIRLYTETMGKEFAKEILCKLIDDAKLME